MFEQYLESAKQQIMFHSTPSKNIGSILKNGLDPEKTNSRQRGVYLTNDQSIAENYQGFNPTIQWTLLAIDTSKLNKHYFGPDEYELQSLLDTGKYDDEFWSGVQWYDLSWVDSLRISGQVVYFKKIPPSAIKIVKTMEPWY